ncbi:transposase [Chroogloeocystis siderophila 5.2 s.c.1]|uniref:Transposase n=1 Tax=Chroogloeocystis siderophila 5.2 s.c.1 TaxID=247279 RepID=A0A1U7HIF6_9CHRO|nr:transposase [Chroogloeocystis siderophila 5.2 s.c.1]
MTRPRLQVVLSTEEDRTLLELRTATTVPQRTKDRAEVLRLSQRGWTTEQIAEYFDWRVETVRETIYRWRDQGLGGLWDAQRPGRRPQWQAADMAHVEQWLQQDTQTHNAQQVVHQLQKERQVTLSPRQLRRILKKRATVGSAPDRAIEACTTQ